MSTKREPVDEETDVPETPKWTKFFDGPLFQKYEEFMKSHDFSKILMNSSMLKLKDPTAPDYDIPDLKPDDRKNSDRNTSDTKESEKEKEKMDDPRLNSDSDNFLTSSDFQKRQRRTRGLVALGVVAIAAVALATGLVIHYLVIPKDSNIKKQYNISLAGNISRNYMHGTTTTKITPTVRKEESNKLDVLKSAVEESKTLKELESKMENVFTIVKNKQQGILKTVTSATTSRKPPMTKTPNMTKNITASTKATTILKATKQMSTVTTKAATTQKTIRNNTTKSMPRKETTTTKETTLSIATTTASTTTTTTKKATTTQSTTTLPDKYSMKPMP